MKKLALRSSVTSQILLTVLLVLLLVSAAGAESSPPDAKCDALSKLQLPNTTFLLAHRVAAGGLSSEETFAQAPAQTAKYQQVPAFCRVRAVLKPSFDSEITMELWLPVKGWNTKFRGQGNGGFAGVIDYDHLAWSVMRGYASAATDTGHTGEGTDARWALGHPEKIADFGYRAIHEMTEKSKAIVAAYYGSPAKHAYFASCSDGGREALMEAQRYPTDYDGILAGAPAINWTHLLTNAASNQQIFARDPAANIPPAKLPAIAAAVLTACDKLDGVSDGILNDPRQCRFDPATLACKADDPSTADSSCLTPPQVAALKKLYAGTQDEHGKTIFPGYPPGAEIGPNGWGAWITGVAPGQSLMNAFATGFFTNMVYDDSAWDLKTFRIDEGLAKAMAATSHALDATDPDLNPFLSRGGKLILYHGWNDPAISALNTINYFQQVVATTGKAKTESSVRLYMVPGLQHCFQGPGPDTFGQVGWSPNDTQDDSTHSVYNALENWVEQHKAPAAIIATKYEGDGSAGHLLATRPLCPYPKSAKYKGTGDPNTSSSFTCADPAPHK